MRILISNDDGIEAPGIKLLERIALCLTDDVTVVAPAGEQSGKGRSLTLTDPIRMRSFGPRHHAVAGTPTDAVIMGLGLILKDSPPDLILSGINRGSNLGEDVSYSGTVAAAMEGTFAGIRSIALSQVYAGRGKGMDVSFDAAEGWAEKVLRTLLAADAVPGVMLNVNFPPVPSAEVRGVKVVRQGIREHAHPDLKHGLDPRGFDYWWLGLSRAQSVRDAGTDLEAAREGFVTVTPLHLDLTHDRSLADLERLF